MSIQKKLLAAAILGGAMITLALALPGVSDPKPADPPKGPLTPKEELATFKVAKGFKVELVAAEPEVIDPVAMAFDENGRLYIAEMRGYPNAGVGTGDITSGKIRLLEDRDGDGYYERATTFAEGLRFPTGLMPWKGGLLAAVAPDIVFFEDTDGDGKADKQRTLYTGFGLTNIQQLINSLQWSLDNWVHGCAGSNGGTVRSAEKKDAPEITLRNRGVRFHPEEPGSLEPTSGGGQYGLAADDWGQWFTNTNSQHLRHIVVPDHYLRRNPTLAVSATTIDIPDHGAACKVHRISAFEAWRVERTTRRKDGPEAKRFAATELVPGGFVTSACSPVVYTADLFPEAYRGNTFICDPANNLIHRDVLVPNGVTFIAQRGDADHEFLASTDNWFRPTFLCVGPDGALYILDFYREVIETPLSLPDDIKKKLNLESRDRGRIWRVAPEGTKPLKKPALGKAKSAELVALLESRNSWQRLTAQRLLVERQDKAAIEPLQRLARDSKNPVGRAHALWTLDGLKALDEKLIANALKDPEAGVREQALKLAEPRLKASGDLQKAVVALAEDKSPRVRYQLAFTLGEARFAGRDEALARILDRDPADPWVQTAVLSSLPIDALGFLKTLTKDGAGERARSVLVRVAAAVGASGSEDDIRQALELTPSKSSDRLEPWRAAILEGLGQGLPNRRPPLALWEKTPEKLKDAVVKVRPAFEQAAKIAADAKRPLDQRLDAIRLLGYGPFDIGATLESLLAPQEPSEIQLPAIRALAQQSSPKVPDLLLGSWRGLSPAARREATEALFARPERLTRLLDAIEAKAVHPGQLEPARLDQLRKHANAKIRQRALKLLEGLATPDRKKIVDDYQPALDLKADAKNGKAIFKKNCATCHRLENEGVEVGPDLLSALKTKNADALLIDILDPSREVDPRYLDYQVRTESGRVFSGMIVSETGNSITLRRAEKAEDIILRSQIDTIEAGKKSLMPDGLEMQIPKQEMADLIAYLRAVAGVKE